MRQRGFLVQHYHYIFSIMPPYISSNKSKVKPWVGMVVYACYFSLRKLRQENWGIEASFRLHSNFLSQKKVNPSINSELWVKLCLYGLSMRTPAQLWGCMWTAGKLQSRGGEHGNFVLSPQFCSKALIKFKKQ